jgi:hypothetical protein
MIKSIIAILLISITISGHSQNFGITTMVDERAELMSIVFRLAGAEEYVNNDIKIYTTEIDKYFKPFKNHKVIKFIKKIRTKNGVSYDAVMSMAVHIEIEKGNVKLKDNIDTNSLDIRWGEDRDKFVAYLNDFYKTSGFNIFFKKNIALYNKAQTNFEVVLKTIDFDWFKKYYGEIPQINFNLILSLSNGGGNYGPSIAFKDGTQNIYSIIGAWEVDSSGCPKYSNDMAELVIHEFSHSFCNPLIDENYSQMKENAEKFYELVKVKMQKQDYKEAKTMLYETLVRASVIKYLQSHTDTVYVNKDYINTSIAYENFFGFVWISPLIDLLSLYENGDYLSLKAIMPQIVKLQNSLTPEKILNDYKESCPYIVSTNIKNGDKNVDPNLKEIVVNFDRPMSLNRNGSTTGKLGKKTFPKVTGTSWNKETRQQWILSIELKSNTLYSIKFPADWFCEAETSRFLKESYYLEFKTGKK